MDKMLKRKRQNQQGISLYFTVIITTVLLGMVLGLSTILINQIKTVKEMGDSVVAFYAADTGMERILYLDSACRQLNCTDTWPTLCSDTCEGFIDGHYETSSPALINNASYWTTATTTPSGSVIFRSRGEYKNTRRAIETIR